MINLGASNALQLRLGAQKIVRVYLGVNMVWNDPIVVPQPLKRLDAIVIPIASTVYQSAGATPAEREAAAITDYGTRDSAAELINFSLSAVGYTFSTVTGYAFIEDGAFHIYPQVLGGTNDNVFPGNWDGTSYNYLSFTIRRVSDFIDVPDGDILDPMQPPVIEIVYSVV